MAMKWYVDAAIYKPAIILLILEQKYDNMYLVRHLSQNEAKVNA